VLDPGRTVCQNRRSDHSPTGDFSHGCRSRGESHERMLFAP
jgi:hypothetical protein